MAIVPCRNGRQGAGAHQILADQLTLSEPRGVDYENSTLLVAPSRFLYLPPSMSSIILQGYQLAAQMRKGKVGLHGLQNDYSMYNHELFVKDDSN